MEPDHIRDATQMVEQPAPAREPEFFKHSVDAPYDWSEWVCPDPKGYLMKCCDCGLVHEAEFGVVQYKSEAEREDCEMVDDPNLQAVFRMRRSEQWSPKDTAHRAGGLPMEPDPDELTIAYLDGMDAGKKAERKRIVNLLMIQHEAANGAHNYWKVAANLIQADVASDT